MAKMNQKPEVRKAQCRQAVREAKDTKKRAVKKPAAPKDKALFVNKIQENATKKAAAGGSMVDANLATEAELQAELDKVRLALLIVILTLIF